MGNASSISFEDSDGRMADMGRRSAFTLIELLVVIAIIALLMSILMPALNLAKDQAKAVLCLSNLHQLGIVCSMHSDDHGGRMPHLKEFDWITPMYEYYKDIKLLRCPSASKPEYIASYNGELVGGKFKAWLKWRDYNKDGLDEMVIGSYGINMFMGENAKEERAEELLWQTTIVKGASFIPVLTDSAEDEDTVTVYDDPPEWDGQVYNPAPSGMRNIHEIRDRCIDRHMRNIHVLFDDWHVSKVTLKKLWRLRWHREWETRIRWRGLPTQWNKPTHWMFGYPDE
jgi:prepilin-type N-terminal cleavage/methylation domain-containing protein